MGDRITDLYLDSRLDAGNDVSYASAWYLVTRIHLHLQHADLIRLIFLSCVEELDLVALADRSVDNLEVCDDSSEGIEYRVEDKGLKRSLGIADRSRDPLDDGIKDLLHAFSSLAGSEEDLLRLAAYKVDDLVGNDVDHRRINIYLIKYRYDFEIMFDSEIQV